MITLIIIAIVTIALYFYSIRTFKYWEKRGIKYEKPIPLFGNYIKSYFSQSSMTHIANNLYWKYPNERVVGYYQGMEPELLIRDPELIKSILSTEFLSFHIRGLFYDPYKAVIEPIMQNMLFVDGDLWKLLRKRVSPAFTTGKLKAIFPLIVERAKRLKARALENSAGGKALDARELIARYTMDLIGAYAFGLDVDTLNEDDSAFRRLCNSLYEIQAIDVFKSVLQTIISQIFKNFKVWSRVERDFENLVREICKERNHQPSGRNDFLDLMLECKQKGTIVGLSLSNVKPDGMPEEAKLEFNNGLLAAQLFMFFAAGFETTIAATSFTLHQLAFNQDVQKKAQDDVDCVLAKYDGKLSYDAVQDMKYLEWTFKEAMRLMPPVGFLYRRSTKPHTFPELNLTIKKDMGVLIPVHALHNDPKYFTNPEQFRPERFSPEEFDARFNYVYLPFGQGPRACIGEKLGLMQSLAGLAAVLSAFTVYPVPETLVHPVVNPKADTVQIFKGGIPLLFRKRK